MSKRPIFSVLVEIRSNAYSALLFENMDTRDCDDSFRESEQGDSLHLTVRDSEGNKSFYFDNVQEAVTFAKRMQSEAERFLS